MHINRKLIPKEIVELAPVNGFCTGAFEHAEQKSEIEN